MYPTPPSSSTARIADISSPVSLEGQFDTIASSSVDSLDELHVSFSPRADSVITNHPIFRESKGGDDSRPSLQHGNAIPMHSANAAEMSNVFRPISSSKTDDHPNLCLSPAFDEGDGEGDDDGQARYTTAELLKKGTMVAVAAAVGFKLIYR